MRAIPTVLLVASLFVAGCGKKEKVELDLPVRPVNYVQVSGDKMQMEKEFSGTIVPKVITTVSFKVTGTIKERVVDLGDRVNKGDVLAKLDPIDYQLNFNRAKALFENAKSTFQRDRILYLEESISKAEYDRSLADYKAREAEMNSAGQQLSYTQIVATAPGEIAQVEAEINQTVDAGQTIFLINELGGLEVEFTVPDVNINSFKLGQEADVKVVATGDVIKAVISNIGSVSTAYGKTYPIKANLLNANEYVKPGMIANVNLKINSREGKAVPGISVSKDNSGQKFVYVIKDVKDGVGIIAKKPLETGGISGKKIEVKSGLDEGDLVVTDGAAIVYEGQKVKLGEKGE